MSPESSREARHRMNQREIFVIKKNPKQKKNLYWYASYRNGYKKGPWINLSERTWNSCALPRKAPAMSRFLTKQGSMETYWRKEAGEQTHGIGALFLNTDTWGNFKQLRGRPGKNNHKVFPHTRNGTCLLLS